MFLALALSAATPAAMAPAKPCRAHPEMARLRESARIRPLAEMPPAKQVQAVYREVDGCAKLAVVREQVGAPARR